MKIKFFSLVALIAMTLSSCSTTVYYQLYKTASVTKDISTQNDELVYEDSNCKISYNFWSSGGDAAFVFYNKTNENIKINLSDSYFIMNGIAFDYYKNRTFTTSSGESLAIDKKNSQLVQLNTIFGPVIGLQSAQKGFTHSSGSSVAVTESMIISIPSKTAKIISEFSINELRIKNCNLLKYPSKKQVQSVSYSEKSSPFVFSNRISYSVGAGSTIKFENEFYVSEISNHPSNEFKSFKRNKECDENITTEVYNYAAADKFYILYSKGTDLSKH